MGQCLSWSAYYVRGSEDLGMLTVRTPDKPRVDFFAGRKEGGCERRFSAVQPAARQGVKELANADDANVHLKDADLKQVLAKFDGTIKPKIDILGFDACRMGMAEICHEVRSYVSVVVASDDDVPKESWPYDLIVSDLAKFPGMDRNSLSSLIISRFIERYSQKGGGSRVSLSAYDLQACKPFADRVKKLIDAMRLVLHEEEEKSKIIRARDFSRTPGEAAYIDICAFCSELARSFPDDHPIHAEATEILDLVQSEPYIIYKRSNGQDGAIDFYGLAIYFPESLDPRMVGTNAPVTGSASIPAPAPNRQQGVKLPPYVYPNVKTSIAPDGSLRQMVSYGVIWSDYLKLDFNKATGWANFIAEFLPEGQIPKKPVKKSRYPPKLENAAQ